MAKRLGAPLVRDEEAQSQSPDERGHRAASTDGGRGKAGKVRELQISHKFCKPICKPDAPGQAEREETQKVWKTSRRGSIEVIAVTIDDPRRQRRTSYGS
jgi:hypothetical protein